MSNTHTPMAIRRVPYTRADLMRAAVAGAAVATLIATGLILAAHFAAHLFF